MSSREREPVPWEALVRIPADVDKEDHVLAGLTARQCAQLAGVAAVLWLGWHASAGLVPPLLYGAGAAVVLAAAVALVMARREGVSLELWLTAAWQHHRAPHHFVPVLPERGDDAWPPDLDDPGALSPLALPVASLDRDGTLLLADGGVAVLGECATVNFALRTPGEQQVLVAAFGRWLNALTAPVQVLVRTELLDLAPVAAELERQAVELPHPLLEDAAWEHAGFLAELASERDLLARQVVLVHREAAGDLAAVLRAHRRAEEAVALLAAAEVRVSVPDAAGSWRVLTAACDPASPAHPAPALPDSPVTATSGGGSAC
ncbi:PrgI family protein [Streptacidiphilus albus]|uniref:PrgI family protein n=1 Tax=Streptacidiphilus albus TaxID=105425 RepID=UPI0005A69915|nr:PrgI family protein [Streptacidiphilus albus]